MQTSVLFSSLLAIVLVGSGLEGIRYEPTWESLDTRPLPSWYDEAKLGIFIHWGVFSVPSAAFPPHSMVAWFWLYWKEWKDPNFAHYMEQNFRPDFTYADFAPQLTMEFFDPYQWADIFSASQAEYIVFTSKHHEGYTNWPSKYSFNWNSMAVGPKRDVVGELAEAIRKNSSLHFGLYHSLFEWFNPLYMRDKANNYTTQDFVNAKTMPELYELVTKYKPDVVWSDGEWEADSSYWKSQEFVAWLYNDSPVKDFVVTNDRWGKDARCQHGGFLTCSDRYNPGVLVKRKWENAMTVDSLAWGFRRNAKLSEFLTTHQLLSTFIETVSCGGNMLMNVGPTKEGRINPIFEERLRDIGSWLSVNGEAIKRTRPWTHQNDTLTPNVWYTRKNDTVYAITLQWPTESQFILAAPMTQSSTTVELLGYSGRFSWSPRSGSGIAITIPTIPVNKMPCKWAWVFRLSNLVN